MVISGGVWDESDSSTLPPIAAMAQHYNWPIYQVIGYLKETRKKYGDLAVQLELDFVLGLRKSHSDEIEKLNKK